MTAVEEERAPTAAPPPPRRNTLLAVLLNSWRQLTSMRTALVLLFLLAIAAIPGSVLPQNAVNAENVTAYYGRHPQLAPWIDRLGGFDVYSSAWFSAMVSPRWVPAWRTRSLSCCAHWAASSFCSRYIW